MNDAFTRHTIELSPKVQRARRRIADGTLDTADVWQLACDKFYDDGARDEEPLGLRGSGPDAEPIREWGTVGIVVVLVLIGVGCLAAAFGF